MSLRQSWAHWSLLLQHKEHPSKLCCQALGTGIMESIGISLLPYTQLFSYF